MGWSVLMLLLLLVMIEVGRGGEGSSRSERACELGLIGGLLIGVADVVLLVVERLSGERS